LTAASHLPERLRAVLNPRTTLYAMKTAPASILSSVEQARTAFNHTAASTVIRTGERLKMKSAPPAPAAQPAVQVVNVVKETAKPVTLAEQPAAKPAAQPEPEPAPPPETPLVAMAATTTVAAQTTLAAPAPVVEAAPPKATLQALPESQLTDAGDADVRALLVSDVEAWVER